jgi:hypothetical protein
MSFVKQSLEVRRAVREFVVGWINPAKLRAEARREELSERLQEHWPGQAIEAYELIRENWDSPEGPATSQALQFAVFIDCEFDVDWITHVDLPAESSHAATRADAVGGRQSNHLSRGRMLEFKRMIGHAIVAAIRGGIDESRQLADEAALFLKERTIERSRTWTLQSAQLSIFVIALAIVAGFAALRGYPPATSEPVITGLFLAVLGGSLGAYISVMQKAGRGEWDAAAGLAAHLIEVFSKVAAGTLLGAVAFAFTQSTHAPSPLASTAPDHYSAFVFGFFAGFFERIIPKIVSNYPHSSDTA